MTRWTLYLFVCMILVLEKLSPAEHKSCALPKPKEKKVYFCESISLGTGRMGPGKQNYYYSVRFISSFFRGLTRLSTATGFDFRKGERTVKNYPDHFIISVEPFSSSAVFSQPSIPGQPALIPVDETPRRVVLRWRDSQGKVLDEESHSLEQVVEPWPEQSTPRLWFSGTVAGNHPLVAEIDVLVFTQASSPVEMIRVCALGLCTN
jgi:hypothetical protein